MILKTVISSTLTAMFAIGMYQGIVYLEGNQPFNTIPRNNEINQEYVQPSQLEIKLKDLDGNGTNETILKYQDAEYLFKVDENGRPIVQAYEIQPIQIKSK
jgi:hypothetical protein